MFAEEEMKNTAENEAKKDYYSSYFDELDKDDDEDTVEVKKATKVAIEDPVEEKEPKKFDWSDLGNLSMITAFVTIAFVILGKLFLIIGANVVGYIFYWIGGLTMLASLGCYVVQMTRNHQVKFEPQLIILILAIIAMLV